VLYRYPRETICVGLGAILLLATISKPSKNPRPDPASMKWNSSADIGRTQYLADDSDWWSMLRADDNEKGVAWQNREPPAGILRILGIDLDENWDNSQLFGKIGPATTVQRGDAGTGRAQTCYRSEASHGDIHLIFERGEVTENYYLFQGGPPWNGESLCAPSNLITKSIRNEAGLGLGETRQQVMELLGKPSLSTPSGLVYFFSLQKKTSAEDLKNIRKTHPHMSEKELEEKFGSYDLWFEVGVRFRNSKSNYVGVLWGETD
jgi:hypothetical protein